MLDGKLEVPVVLRIRPQDLNGINLLAHKLRIPFEKLIQEWIDLDIDRHIVTRPAGAHHEEPDEKF